MSEKLTSWSPRPAAHRAKSRIVALYTLIALVALTLWYRQPKWVFTRIKLPVERPTAIPDDLLVDWDKITPSEDLTWTPCFHILGNFSCARLTVPMDYSRPLSESTENPKVHIALVLLPGKGHSELTGNFSESPLLLNPGGPGGSGAMFVVGAGVNLQKVMGPEQDLIGFDPRGIGATWPQTDCFIGDHEFGDNITVQERNRVLMHRYTWMAGSLEIDLPNKVSSQNLFKAATRSKAMNKLCKNKDGADSIFKYTGTPHVAQDMLSIVQAWDRYTSKVKSATTPPKCTKSESSSVETTDDGPPSTRGKLVFWGFSYGTFLGATFASMFPDSVGRLVLDGVVDSDLYFHRTAWSGAIRDTDAILESFYPSCLEAGVECKLFRVGDNEEDIRKRFRTVLNYLENEPFLSVPPAPGLGLPGILTISLLKRMLFSTMYFPVALFPLVALIVDMLYTGLGFSIGSTPDLFPICGLKDKLIQYPEDSSIAIGCSDWRDQRRMTFPEYEKEYEHLSNHSSFADVWMQLITECNGWTIQQIDPPSMDWDRFPTGDKPPVNTSFPILFVSSTHDPVTPLQQALIMSQRFVNSGLIEQLSNGHTSLSAVSLCSLGKIKDYLGRGIVPDPPKIDAPTPGDDTIKGKWTQCKADEKPWKPYSAQYWADASTHTQENLEMMEAWQQVQKVAREMDHFSHLRRLPEGMQRLLWTDYESAEMILRSTSSEEGNIGSL